MKRFCAMGIFLVLVPACPGDDGSNDDSATESGTTMPTTSMSGSGTAPATSMSGSSSSSSSSSTTDPTDGTTTDPPDMTTTSGNGTDPGGSTSTGAGVQPIAVGTIVPKSDSTAEGTVAFFADGDQIRVEVNVESTMPTGLHGMHIHMTGDCSADDASSAGGHWNPAGAEHGPFEAGHLGDLGNIDVTNDGTGELTLTTTMGQWAVGTGDDADLIGRALILHELEDDLSTAPNPGPRIGCAEIEAP